MINNLKYFSQANYSYNLYVEDNIIVLLNQLFRIVLGYIGIIADKI